MPFALLPTTPGSPAAFTASVVNTLGTQSGGGEVYGNAWTSAPSPSTAACRLMTASLLVSEDGVERPDSDGVAGGAREAAADLEGGAFLGGA